MTLREVIDRVDDLIPNVYEESHKVRWISELDAKIFNEVYMTHEDNPYTREKPEEEEEENVTYFGDAKKEVKTYLELPYTINKAAETELLAEFPYDELYVAFLETKINEYNQETTRYNNSALKFNGLYNDFVAYYNRTHMPLERGK